MSQYPTENIRTLTKRYLQAWQTFLAKGSSCTDWRSNWLYKRCQILGQRIIKATFPTAKLY